MGIARRHREGRRILCPIGDAVGHNQHLGAAPGAQHDAIPVKQASVGSPAVSVVSHSVQANPATWSVPRRTKEVLPCPAGTPPGAAPAGAGMSSTACSASLTIASVWAR